MTHFKVYKFSERWSFGFTILPAMHLNLKKCLGIDIDLVRYRIHIGHYLND